MISQPILDEVVSRLVSSFKPLKIILFGSVARGVVDEESDIDLLVITHMSDGRHELMLEMIRALRDLPVPKDIVLMTPDEFERDRHIPGTVALPASLEGKVLYERSNE